MPLSAFHPTVQAWFAERLGEPTPPQRRGWPEIRAGHHTLIAAPTGSGKTLAAFLAGIDGLLRMGDDLTDTTTVLYDLHNDPHQETPISDTEVEERLVRQMIELMRSNDAPREAFERLELTP